MPGELLMYSEADMLGGLENERTRAWLDQFMQIDRKNATRLLDALVYVSGDAFVAEMSTLLRDRLEAAYGPIACFVESERGHRKGVPHRLFKNEPRRKSGRRVTGRTGPPLVPRGRNVGQEVGSEGIVASLLTQVARQHPGRIHLSPGPDTFREKGIRRLVFVTDFIGSGDRMWQNLEAAWRVRSVRSWWSRRSGKGTSLEVVAYSATRKGLKRLRAHPAQPDVHIAQVCPTLASKFSEERKWSIEGLCKKYLDGHRHPLGWSDAGTLIAFAHGIPNNAPAVFWARQDAWVPLFPARVTTAAGTPFPLGATDMLPREADVIRCDDGEGQPRAGPVTHEDLVLSGLCQTRQTFVLSERLGVPLARINDTLLAFFKRGWIDRRNHLTDRGRAVLRRRTRVDLAIPLPSRPPGPYYPSALRVPRDI